MVSTGIATIQAVPYRAPGDQALAILDEGKFVDVLFDILKLIATQRGEEIPPDGELLASAREQYERLLDADTGEAEAIALRDHIREHAPAIESVYGENVYALIGGLQRAREVLSVRSATRERIAGLDGDTGGVLELDKKEEILFKDDGHKLTDAELARLRAAGFAGMAPSWGPKPIDPETIHKLVKDPADIDTVELSSKLSDKLASEWRVSRDVQAGPEDGKTLVVSEPIQGALRLIGNISGESHTPIHTLMKAWEDYKIPVEIVLDEFLDDPGSIRGAGPLICAILDKHGTSLKTADNGERYYKAMKWLIIMEESKCAGWVLRKLTDEVDEIPMEHPDVLVTLEKLGEDFSGGERYLLVILASRLPDMAPSETKSRYQLLYLKIVSAQRDETDATGVEGVQRIVLDDLAEQEFLPEDPAPTPGKWPWSRPKLPVIPPTPVERLSYADNVCAIVLQVLEMSISGEGEPLAERVIDVLLGRQRVLMRLSSHEWMEIWEFLGDHDMAETAQRKGLQRLNLR